MPLFKHKNRDNAATSNAAYNPNTQPDDTTGHNNAPGTTGAGGNLPRRNQDAQNDPAYPPSNTAPGVTGVGGNLLHKNQHGQNDPSSNAPGGYNTMAGRNDQFTGNDQSQQQGYGAGGTTGTGAALSAMPPQTDAHGNPVHPKTVGGGSRLGKVESAVGNMFGSESLKQKGLEKENESQALKVQAAELGEAERLEKEALARRQRAVAHGAHPDHKYLGSHNPSAAGNVNERGGETGSGGGGIGGASGNSRRGY